MILIMGSNDATNKRRIGAAGIDIKGPVLFEESGFRMPQGVEVSVRKNAVSLDINQDVYTIIGGKAIHFPNWLNPGDKWTSTLESAGQRGFTETQEAQLGALPWIFRARVHQVGMPS